MTQSLRVSFESLLPGRSTGLRVGASPRAALVAAAFVVASSGGLGRARAEDSGGSPPVCAPTESIDPLRLLRQASLDLRGEIPNVNELERVRDAADPAAEAESMIAEMVGAPSYYRTVREYHRSLLWSTLANLPNIVPAVRRLSYDRAGDRWRILVSANLYRGRPGLFCLDQEQTEFDEEGRPVPILTFDADSCRGGTCRQEGWVWVRPYWDPETPIRVCAFDAQNAEVGLYGAPCDGYAPDPACGCGDDLRRCTPGGLFEAPIREALTQEPLRIVEDVVRRGAPYEEILTTRTTFVNGASAHFYRYMAGAAREDMSNGVVYETALGILPEELDFQDQDTWMAVEREEVHAGVLTTVAYLMRFASDRARANQFYSEFLCDPFVPSEDGLPAEEDDPPPNLRERSGCADCHRVLEPAAAHWGRWRNNTIYGFFRPELMSFTEPYTPCARCGDGTARCSAFCEAYFVTPGNAHEDEVALYRGLPLAARWLEDQDLAAVEEGPRALVDEPAEVDQVARCAVRNLAQRLLGRPLEIREQRWLEDQTRAFVAGGRRFDDLVRALVADPKYRAIR